MPSMHGPFAEFAILLLMCALSSALFVRPGNVTQHLLAEGSADGWVSTARAC